MFLLAIELVGCTSTNCWVKAGEAELEREKRSVNAGVRDFCRRNMDDSGTLLPHERWQVLVNFHDEDLLRLSSWGLSVCPEGKHAWAAWMGATGMG